MKTTLALAICLLLFAVFFVDAKVVVQKEGTELLLSQYKLLRAENTQCKKSLRSATDNYDAQNAVIKRDTTEIEIIKRLLASTRIMVHARHNEKSRLVTLLKRLLAKLLADAKKNKKKLVPLRHTVVRMKDHCKTTRKAARRGRQALAEVRNALKNQRYLDSTYTTNTKNLKVCRKNLSAVSKKLRNTTSKYNSYKKKHNTHSRAHSTCRRALKTQHNHHKTAKKTEKHLENKKSAANNRHQSCRKSLANAKATGATCAKDVATCQSIVSSLHSSILGQTRANKLCEVENNHCEVAHKKNVEKCEKTKDKVENFQDKLDKCNAATKVCTPKMTKVTTDLETCLNKKFKLNKQLSYVIKHHAGLARELSKFMPLTDLPTKPVEQPKPVVQHREDIPAPSKSSVRCQSTGDPHYYNFARNRFDVYNNFGMFTLVHYKHVLTVQTNIRRSRRYGIRGLNSEIAIGSYNNVVTLVNYVLKVNGKRVNLGYHKSLKIRDGVVIRRATGHTYVLQTPEGAVVTMSQHNIGERWAYSNLYVDMPSNYASASEGLCKPQSPSITLSKAFLTATRPSKAALLFNKSYHIPAITVVKGGKLHDNIKWKSVALKNAATEYCAKLKLTPEQTVDCLLDAKLAGQLNGAKTYEGMRNLRKLTISVENANRHNAAGHTLRELTRLKNIFSIETSRMLKIRAKLNPKSRTLLEDTDNMLKRFKRELTFVTHLQSVFGDYVLKKADV